jgi:CTP synthase
MIPHVTGEVKRKLRELALRGDGTGPATSSSSRSGAPSATTRTGSTSRRCASSRSRRERSASCFVALTYVIEPKALGEQKSKAAQLGIKRLMEAGVQPNLIACRATRPVHE